MVILDTVSRQDVQWGIQGPYAMAVGDSSLVVSWEMS
jgi:hypothetical protein